jgi:hypothetical protein
MKPKHFFLLLLLTISCKSQDKDLYQFDPRTLKENKITLSEIADDITYIPLDNSFPISLIYSPRYFINNSIYLSALNSGVMVFDRKGKLLRKIGSIGRGPGEYNYYYKFTVDDNSETVCVLDFNIIKVYSKTGLFLRNISLKEYGEGVDAIEFYDSKFLVSFPPQYAGSIYDWVILDTLGNLVNKKARTIPKFTSNWPVSGGIYKFENRIYRWHSYNDTIFSILPGLNYEPSFLFSPGEHRVPRSELRDLKIIGLYFNPSSVLETSRFLAISYGYNKKLTIALVDKKSKKSYLTYLESGPAVLGNNFIGGIFNDLDGGVRIQPENYFAENGREYMFTLINPIQIKALVSNNEFKNSSPNYPEKKKELEKMVNSLKETDNQVLMIVRLKK